MATRKIPFGDYVRQHYGLDLKRGQHVLCGDKRERGIVTGADNHVHVRLEGQKHSDPWHPSDIHVYEDAVVAAQAAVDAGSTSAAAELLVASVFEDGE